MSKLMTYVTLLSSFNLKPAFQWTLSPKLLAINVFLPPKNTLNLLIIKKNPKVSSSKNSKCHCGCNQGKSTPCHSERSRGISELVSDFIKSSKCGFNDLIRFNFFCLFQFFNCFSLAIAKFISV